MSRESLRLLPAGRSTRMRACRRLTLAVLTAALATCTSPTAAQTTLKLDLPTFVTEGSPTGTGGVSIASPAPFDRMVDLQSSDPAHLSVPSHITIPQGATAAPFSFAIPDNDLFEGDRTVTVRAYGNQLNSAVVTVIISDNDVHHLRF